MKDLNKIKCFATDIDGVWTDGGMYYDQTGNEFKKFNTSDSAGVLFLRLLGMSTVIITGEDTEIVRRRAEKLKISHFFPGIKDKLGTMVDFCSANGFSLDEVAYIGDDLNDMKLLKAVGLSACPDNAPEYIKRMVDWPLPVSGGNGAYRCFVEKFMSETNRLELVLEKYNSTSNDLNQ
jgi:3-deoxy-D-glycero-D-galacto-nononate 9-phosphatase